ncbi:MAG: competence protein ComJ [Candidatus Amulumruptor caecigallinarius]|nr:competence protein ComJ [Candidatus Amulumruptor caecigallinarius]MCM1397062.1 competence protein ComJ [Candidatus Amulumruptor caecigallinarius]MCM1454010.1 competence protein ComJ [bacterium]
MKLLHCLTIAAVTGLLCGCDVHEFPSEDVPVQPASPEPVKVFRLNLRHNSDMPLLGEFDYTAGGVTAPSSRGFTPDEAQRPHDIRYTVNAYPMVNGEPSRVAGNSVTVTRSVDSGLDTSLSFPMPEGDYSLIVWTDYVDAGAVTDKYYNTSDFQEIILADRLSHSGSNPWRDAFYGEVHTCVRGLSSRAAASDTVTVGEATVTLQRPMARYTFVSTDLRRFLENEFATRSAGATPRTTALSDYIVRFVYTRYMPCAFNAFTGHPADSWTGVSFESTIRQLNDDEAEVGFDYVFVNGTRTAVTVGLEVLDRDGNLLARIPPFDVPLERSRHTIVRGEFLTTKSGGEMGINPDYDGEFNIEIK